MQLKRNNRVDPWAQNNYLSQVQLNSFSLGNEPPNKLLSPNH